MRFDDIEEGDLLTMEVQLKREGTLPPTTQALLIEALRHNLGLVDEMMSNWTPNEED